MEDDHMTDESLPEVPERAKQLHEDGRAAGARGELEDALRLLTEAAESPLYNPRLTEEDLDTILRRIRSGIRRSDQD